jgi:hypothetical protein
VMSPMSFWLAGISASALSHFRLCPTPRIHR